MTGVGMTAAISPTGVPDLLGTAPADLIDRFTEMPVATRDVAVRRAERIRAGVASYAAMRQDIADAYSHRDWLALDYATWHEYVQGEFGEELRALARDDRREAVSDLRAQGMSMRQIGSAVGVSQEQVRRDIAQVSPVVTPGRVNGSDGKQYSATRPSTADTPPPSTSPGQDLPPARPKPPAWDPEERRQHEEELRRLDDIRSARQQATTLVTDVRALIFTVLQGSRQGERGLVTRNMIADLRKAIDLLEGEIDDGQ